MKKLMSLGGNYFQMTAVKAAKRLGYYVIDVDYLENNPAHKYADEYHNISTLDCENVLKLAKEKEIDGIIAFASDVSAPTAAYVASEMGLPTNSIESVNIMTRKNLFHPFLKANGFYVPECKEVTNISQVYEFYDEYKDIMLKPINSSGSKGVSHITENSQIMESYDEAKKYSRGDILVVEQFIKRDGYQIAGDAFVVNGQVEFFGFANEHFNDNCNALVPVGESFPATLSKKRREIAKKEIQRAISLIEFKNGPINLDFMFDKEDNIFLIELAPRSGGNLITDAIKLSSGVDLAEYAVKVALGEDVSDLKEKEFENFISSYIWHSEKNGVYENIDISDMLKNKLCLSDMFVKNGESINRFENGGYGLGAALIKYENEEQMLQMMDHMNKYYEIRMR